MTDHINSPPPAHIKRAGRRNMEELLRETLGEKHGERFATYRKNFQSTQNYDKSAYLSDYPITVLIELLNRCNLDCVMCFSAHRQGPKVTVTTETINKLFAEFKRESLPALMFGAGEEPLLYRNIDRLFDLANDAGIMDTFLFTNGTLLTHARCEMIVQKQIARVMISVDAATPDTYNRIRRRNNQVKAEASDRLDAVDANIRRLVEIRERMGAKLPVIRLSFAVQKDNEHEIETFKHKWQDVVDYIEFQSCSDYAPIGELSKLSEEERWARVPKAINEEHPRCPQPWSVLTVWYSGDVSPCCNFSGKNIFVGNIHQQNLRDIWHGDKMRELRDQFQSGDINIVCRQCLNVRDWGRFEKA